MSHNNPHHLDDADLNKGLTYLTGVEPVFTVILNRYGPPPLWKRQERFDSLVKIILEQQVSLASAQAAFDKLVTVLGTITPHSFLTLDDDQLKAVGFSRQKTSYVRNLAHSVIKGDLDFKNLKTLTDEQIRASLTSIKGVGIWTANIYLLMAMQRPDIWPRGDIALAASYQRLKQLPKRPTNEKMEQISNDWAPYRSVAARLLWHYYLSSNKKQSENTGVEKQIAELLAISAD